MPKGHQEEDNGTESDAPKSTFATYVAEGDALFHKGEYKKALESYTTALDIQPGDKGCLVARSRCHLKLGDPEPSLADAEAALEENDEYNKALYQKAEALYAMGDFEYALVFYHRGHKLRPELQEFRLGIQKAQEAIDNAVGSPATVHLENKGDLSYFYKQDEERNRREGAKGKKGKGQAKSQGRGTQKDKKDQQNEKNKRPKSKANDKNVKTLLGELHADKEYLEKLLKDEDLTRKDNPVGQKIHDLVTEGLGYLETRTEFWRQQNPMYARQVQREKSQWKSSKQKSAPTDPAKYVMKHLEEIDEELADGHPEKALKQARKLKKSVDSWSEEELPNKAEVQANLHSCMGNAHLDMDQNQEAMDQHQKEYDIACEHELPEAKSRSLDNLGRVHARVGNFEKAIDAWGQKLPMSKSALEKTWLYHEIGRCHLELNHNEEARDYGEKSFAAAQEAEDDVWQLNASVLIAQAEVKLGDLQAAVESFERALEMAKGQNDEPAQQAIKKALEDVNDRIVRGIKPEELPVEEEEDGGGARSDPASSPRDDSTHEHKPENES